MTFKQTMAAIFMTAEGTYYKWKREKRPIISLLEMYSKEELEEFLENGKIYKYELVKNIDAKELEYIIKNKKSSNVRLQELIKFFSIFDFKILAPILAESLRTNNLDIDTEKYLDVASMKEFIHILRKILNDRSYELVLRDFNEKVGFDFSKDDELTVNHILNRYRVYNTLYNFENSMPHQFIRSLK